MAPVCDHSRFHTHPRLYCNEDQLERWFYITPDIKLKLSNLKQILANLKLGFATLKKPLY